jgi:hypothetical protein
LAGLFFVADPSWPFVPQAEQDDLLEKIEQDNTREKVKRCIVPHNRLQMQREIGKGVYKNTLMSRFQNFQDLYAFFLTARLEWDVKH